MRIIEPSVEIMTEINTQAVYSHLERCGRVCYKSEDKITPESAERFLRGIIKRGHESVLEHQSITVKFICDRGVSHEIVRHRIASYSQSSTRYINYAKDDDIEFINPDVLNLNEKFSKYGFNAWADWYTAMKDAEKNYKGIIDKGCTPQEARSVLPNSVKTELVMTANIREWRHFFRLRCAKAAHPQMRQVAMMLLEQMYGKLPVLFEDVWEEVGNADQRIICCLERRGQMPEKDKHCKNCEYHDAFTWACSCGESDQRGDFTDDEFVCERWEKKHNDG